MIDPLEIKKEIARLEYEESSYSNYAKLATLYAIRDELSKSEQEQRAAAPASLSVSTPSPARAAETDFRAAINGKTQEQVLSVMDELVDSLSISQPKLYSAVMNKLNRL